MGIRLVGSAATTTTNSNTRPADEADTTRLAKATGATLLRIDGLIPTETTGGGAPGPRGEIDGVPQ